LPLTARAPEESTIRKLVRRLGPETVAELTRVVIGRAQWETAFAPRGPHRLDRGRGRHPLPIRRGAGLAGHADAGPLLAATIAIGGAVVLVALVVGLGPRVTVVVFG